MSRMITDCGILLMRFLADSPELYKNTPICLQAVAAKYEDERLIQIMEGISSLLPL